MRSAPACFSRVKVRKPHRRLDRAQGRREISPRRIRIQIARVRRIVLELQHQVRVDAVAARAQRHLEQNKKYGGNQDGGEGPNDEARELHVGAFAVRDASSDVATAYAPIATARPVPSFEMRDARALHRVIGHRAGRCAAPRCRASCARATSAGPFHLPG